MPTLGEKLRELRLKRDLTLKQVSDETQLSLSFLSLLERDKVSVSVDNLEILARCYGIRLVNLFQGLRSNAAQVTRRAQLDEMLSRAAPGTSVFALLSDRADAQMEPMVVRIGAGHGDSQFRTHDGDTLVYVLEGQVRLLSERGEDILLEAGDLAYYPGFPGHRFANASPDLPATLLLVTAPPTTHRDDMLDSDRGVLLQSEI